MIQSRTIFNRQYASIEFRPSFSVCVQFECVAIIAEFELSLIVYAVCTFGSSLSSTSISFLKWFLSGKDVCLIRSNYSHTLRELASKKTAICDSRIVHVRVDEMLCCRVVNEKKFNVLR
jgi:hypothetical protein